MSREFTQDDFEELSWHDNEIHGLALRVGDPEKNDWRSDLVLDIDYIAEWVRDGEGMKFLMAPATLTFHGVTDLSVDLRNGFEGQQISLVLPSIAAIERVPIESQRVFLDRPYHRWRIRFNGTPDGEIAFGAVGFTQILRREAVLCDQPRLDASLR
jgi:hypothetical protein